MDWTADATDEEYEIYSRDMLLRIDPNEDERLRELLSRAYDDIEEEEISNGIFYGDDYVLECTGRMPVDADDINDLVADRDPHALEFFGLTGKSDEELDRWDANDLDELPDVCDFEEGFEASSPYDAGWILRVQFYDFDDAESLTQEEAEKALRLLFTEKDYKAIREYIERAADYIGWNDELDLEEIAKSVAQEFNALDEFEAAE